MDVKDFIHRAKDAAQSDPMFAIWLIEGALEQASDAERPGAVEAANDLAAAVSMRDATETGRKFKRQVENMLNSEGDLSRDEWGLVISILSSLFCLKRFSVRHRLDFDQDLLSSLEEQVRHATRDYRDQDFRAELQAMRKYHPNPLSADIGMA